MARRLGARRPGGKGLIGPAAFRRVGPGYRQVTMSGWLLLAIPGALVLLCGILFVSALVESRALSPQSLIVSAARSRRTDAAFTEAFVAAELERLLGDGRPAGGGAPRATVAPP